MPAADEVDRWLSTADAAAASAGTNTLAKLELAERDSLVLLHSDTPEGRYCAERLKTFYDGKVRDTVFVHIGKLGYGAAQFTSGLKALVDAAIRQVHEGRKKGFQTTL